MITYSSWELSVFLYQSLLQLPSNCTVEKPQTFSLFLSHSSFLLQTLFKGLLPYGVNLPAPRGTSAQMCSSSAPYPPPLDPGFLLLDSLFLPLPQHMFPACITPLTSLKQFIIVFVVQFIFRTEEHVLTALGQSLLHPCLLFFKKIQIQLYL